MQKMYIGHPPRGVSPPTQADAQKAGGPAPKIPNLENTRNQGEWDYTLRRARWRLRVSKGAGGAKGRAYDARDWSKQGNGEKTCRLPIRNQPRAGGWENRRTVRMSWQSDREGRRGVYCIAQYTTPPGPL